MSFKYFHTGNKDVFQFYRFPVQLLKNPVFRNLSDGAKLLITCMIDRRALSEKNGWHDEHGRIYIYYPLHQICHDLSVSKQKAVNMLNQLERAGLIRRTRQGLGRPSRIYVGFISSPEQSNTVPKRNRNRQKVVRKSARKEYENQTSGSALDRILEEIELDPTYTNKNNTDNIYTQRESGKESHDGSKTREEVVEEYERLKAEGEEDMLALEHMLLATN